MKQKRVDPLVFQAFVAERRRAEIAEARVAELEAKYEPKPIGDAP